jgi:hypothetical protein
VGGTVDNGAKVGKPPKRPRTGLECVCGGDLAIVEIVSWVLEPHVVCLSCKAVYVVDLRACGNPKEHVQCKPKGI